MIHPKKHTDLDPFFKEGWVRSITPKRNHIVWIIISYVPVKNSGAECMTHQMNLFLLKHGWTVTVITPEHTKKHFEGVEIIQFDEKSKVQKALQEASVVASYLHYQEFVAKLAKQLDIPYVQVNHNAYQIPYIRDILKIVDPSQFYMIHNSQWLHDHYKKSLRQVHTPGVQAFMKIYESHTCIVFPPLDSSKLRFSVHGKKVTLVNCSKEKGGELFLELARRMPDVEFLGVKGSYNTPLVDTHLGNVTYMENTPTIRKFYEKTQIILMPSHAESWGRVGVEAMTLGIPVIAHPTEGLRESLGSAGLFADNQDVTTWERIIRKLLTDPWFYTRKSYEGKVRAKELENTGQLERMESWLTRIQASK